MFPEIHAGLAIAAAILGLVFGSFATALAYRIPSGQPWAFKAKKTEGVPRSACTNCGVTLKARNLIPLLSWLAQKGRCSACGKPISWTYPATELACACACYGLFLSWGSSVPTLPVLMTVPFLAALIVIDFRYFMLPDILNILLAALWLVFIVILAISEGRWEAVSPVFLSGVSGAALFGFLSWSIGAVMKKILHREALGFGDVKFFAVAGLWLGTGALPFFLILSGFFGVILGGIYRLVTKEAYFPFGPALIVAFYVLLLAKGAAQ